MGRLLQNEGGLDWTYEGGWANGHFEGAGKTVWSDGYVMEGPKRPPRRGRPELEGNRLVHEGNYAEDEHDGKGTFYNLYRDVIYSGAFSNGFLDESAADRKAEPFKKQVWPCPTRT